jgi:hypothetical protein
MKRRCLFLFVSCCLFACGLLHSRVASVGHKNPRMPYKSGPSVQDLKLKKSFYLFVMRYVMYKELSVVYEKLGKHRKFTKCTKRMNKYFNKLVKEYKKAKTKGKTSILNEVLNDLKGNLSNIPSLVGN